MRPRLLLVSLIVAALAGAGIWIIKERSSPRLGQTTYELTENILAIGPRPPGSAGLDAARKLVRSELEAAGWATEGQKFDRMTPIGRVNFENVRARFKSNDTDPWQRRIDGLLCAHIDSKYYKDIHFLGADDAASACAAIVVIASHLARSRPDLASRIELVFFDGEEAFMENITPTDGLYGSRHYANQWRTRDDKPAFGIVLDMIGHADLSIRLPSDTPSHLREAVMAAARAEGVERYFGMAPGPIIDDHVPLNFAGIPSVDIIGDFTRKSWWHTPADNMKIISSESLDISIRVTLRLLDDLLKP
jgi:glutaminyl-peptide cyclotransferase